LRTADSDFFDEMTDYSYTILNESSYLEHIRLIDRGGFGEVHEVRSCQCSRLSCRFETKRLGHSMASSGYTGIASPEN